jgi:hypothetical protein
MARTVEVTPAKTGYKEMNRKETNRKETPVPIPAEDAPYPERHDRRVGKFSFS